MNSIDKKCIGFAAGTLVTTASAMGSKIGVLAMLPISIYALFTPMNETILYGFIGIYTSSLSVIFWKYANGIYDSGKK